MKLTPEEVIAREAEIDALTGSMNLVDTVHDQDPAPSSRGASRMRVGTLLPSADGPVLAEVESSCDHVQSPAESIQYWVARPDGGFDMHHP